MDTHTGKTGKGPSPEERNQPRVTQSCKAAEAPIRVHLVMLNRLMRETLAHVLRRREDLEVAGQGGTGETHAEELVKEGCEVLLVDFVDGEWLSELRTRSTAAERVVRVVAVGMEAESSEFLEAVRCGVSGYLVKNAGANEVVAAVRAAKRGEASCPAKLCMALFQALAERGEPKIKRIAGKTALTLRQQMLMKLVAKGMTNKEIAGQLNLSEFTVKNHVSRILKQLHAESRSAAVDTMRHSLYELRA